MSAVSTAETPEAPKAADVRKIRSWSAPKTAVGRQQERLGWILVIPSLIVVFAVAIYPLLETFRLSFTNTRLASTRAVRWVGFENYQRLLQDDQWWNAMKNTIVFTISSVALETVLGMIVALTIHSQFRGRGLVRTSMLVPWAIPTVVSSLLWNWMLNDRYGVINSIFVRLGFMAPDRNFAWTADPNTALGAVIAIDVWKTTPFMALLLLAGLQVVPGDVYEAAYVDGASKWQQFWQITLPLLRPALLVALIFRTMDSFRVFDLIFVLKGAATETMTVAIYTQQQLIQANRLGYGSAAAVVIFLCIGLMVLGYSRLITVEES
ncbi:MAG: carbohydrate ABC transporter permease [Thermomicrobiales bacterium]|jgi:trehalose/maltose transport system permease protein